MSIELHVRLDYAKIPKVAAALSRARPDTRASLVSGDILTVEELESLAKEEAITAAAQRLSEQLRRTPTGKHRKRA